MTEIEFRSSFYASSLFDRKNSLSNATSFMSIEKEIAALDMSSHNGSFSSEQNGKLNKPVACCVFHDSGVGGIRKELRDAE